MPDDKTKRRPHDSSRLAMTEEYEVNWWTDHFGVTRAQLQAAVNAVGNGAAAVARYLGKPL